MKGERLNRTNTELLGQTVCHGNQRQARASSARASQRRWVLAGTSQMSGGIATARDKAGNKSKFSFLFWKRWWAEEWSPQSCLWSQLPETVHIILHGRR